MDDLIIFAIVRFSQHLHHTSSAPAESLWGYWPPGMSWAGHFPPPRNCHFTCGIWTPI